MSLYNRLKGHEAMEWKICMAAPRDRKPVQACIFDYAQEIGQVYVPRAMRLNVGAAVATGAMK